jgi:Calcineurin-like phosphoesterase
MTAFDVIGDVHGHADRLRGLLASMGYVERHGVWSHPDRTAVYLGDLIDRGPGQLDTLQMVRAMVEVGAAQVVLGNHEFNAVAYATLDPARDDYCRPHSEKNSGQHEAFLSDVAFGSPLHRSIIDWFTTIPMWLDLGGLRVVHACWSADHIEHLEAIAGPGNTLTERIVIDGTTKGTPTHDAVETVLKGPEVHLDGVRYVDKDGHQRDHARLRWWDSDATTLRRAALIDGTVRLHDADGRPIDELHDRPLTDDELRPYTGPDPVLFGHYWWRKETAEPVNPRATCLDFSVAKGGVLRAYRWDGEDRLDEHKFVEA